MWTAGPINLRTQDVIVTNQGSIGIGLMEDFAAKDPKFRTQHFRNGALGFGSDLARMETGHPLVNWQL
jgi:hypothetical protein